MFKIYFWLDNNRDSSINSRLSSVYSKNLLPHRSLSISQPISGPRPSPHPANSEFALKICFSLFYTHNTVNQLHKSQFEPEVQQTDTMASNNDVYQTPLNSRYSSMPFGPSIDETGLD
jgi:hypothetical protein